jgi:hypothetical protein
MKKKHIELRYRDIDPDSGLVVADGLIAVVEPNWSKGLLGLLNGGDEPNRDFYLVEVDQKPVTVKVTESQKTPKPFSEPSAPRNNGYTPYGDFSFDNTTTGKKKRR